MANSSVSSSIDTQPLNCNAGTDSCNSISTFGEPTSPPSSTITLASDSEAHSHCDDHSKKQPPTRDHSNKPQSRHSVKEKRQIRYARKKRKRLHKVCSKVSLKQQLHTEREHLTVEKAASLKYKSMARSFWDRWQWELCKRKEELRDSLCQPSVEHQPIHRQIDPRELVDPISNGKSSTMYIGRGSFSVVRVQLYRGILVAVKELLPRTLQPDVIHEANMLVKLCHPHLPYLFGICTSSQPLRIIVQFHGINLNTVTLFQELQNPQHLTCTREWVMICAQVIDALAYLHTEVKIIHNDIKSNNIVMSMNPTCDASTSTSLSLARSPLMYHAVLIDFGKATEKESGQVYELSDQEKVEYHMKFPHIAPEVVVGEFKQSTYSDIFSLGQLLFRIWEKEYFSSTPASPKETMLALIENCRSSRFRKRPSSHECVQVMKTVVNSIFS